MKDAIDLLCNTTKSTLGPKGSNCIIDTSSFSPFITNDGVTIASNIQSDDKIINTILEIAKEASIKTNQTIGDGTTTTLVLLQAIFNEGLKLIQNNINPMVLKKELTQSLNYCLTQISKYSRIPTEEDLINIATISANDNEIGKLVYEAFSKVKNKSAINVKEWDNNYNAITIDKGYEIPIDMSPYFFKDSEKINLENVHVLLINNVLENLEQISTVINSTINENIPLLIIAKDYNLDALNDILILNQENNLKIYLLKLLDYGFKLQNTFYDLEAILNTDSTSRLEYRSLDNTTKINRISITNNICILQFEISEAINRRIKVLEQFKENNNDEYELEIINKKIAMLKYGIININVGSFTTTERREIKMRVDDALCAIDSAAKGITYGCGTTYNLIANNFNCKTNGDLIIKQALEQPFKVIMYNAGIENKIVDDIKNNHFSKIYNIKNNKMESLSNTTVIDPTNVIIASITNAVSIASMLLTTSSIIINEENQNTTKKINDYNEL